MAYATTTQVAAWLNVTADAADTEKWTRLLDVADATINRECSRRFDSVVETRDFDVSMTRLPGEPIPVGDIVSATEVALADNRSAVTYSALPSGSYVLSGASGEFPDWQVRVTDRPVRQGFRRIRITGTWGWPSVPAAIVQAAIQETARLSLRDQSPQGSATEGLLGAGGGEFGVTGQDIDWLRMLDNYRANRFAVQPGYKVITSG